VACSVLEHKSGTISVYGEPIKEFANAVSNGTILDPLRPSLPQQWEFATPKISIAVISGMGKTTDFKFGRYIHRVHPNKTHSKFWRKGSVGVSRLPNFFEYSLLSQERVKLLSSNFVRTFIGWIGRKDC